MALTPEEQAYKAALEKRKLEPRGNEAIAKVLESPLGQAAAGLLDPALSTIYNGIGGVSQRGQDLFYGLGAFDEESKEAFGGNKKFEPKQFRSSEGSIYDLFRLGGEAAQFAGTKTMPGAFLRAGALGTANNPNDPLEGLLSGLAWEGVGQGVGKGLGMTANYAGKGFMKAAEAMNLDEPLRKVTKELKENYWQARDSAWEKMSPLVEGFKESPLLNKIMPKALPEDKFVEQFTKSKKFKEIHGDESALVRERYNDMTNEIFDPDLGVPGATPIDKYENYVNSAEFKKIHGKDAPAIKAEYDEMFDDMLEYAFENVPAVTYKGAPELKRFFKELPDATGFYNRGTKETINKFQKSPTIGGAYDLTKKLQTEKAKYSGTDAASIEAREVIDSQIKDLKKSMVWAGEQIEPGIGKQFLKGNQEYAKKVAPYYSDPIIEKALEELPKGVLPEQDLRKLVDAIRNMSAAPVRGRAPIGGSKATNQGRAELGDPHFMETILRNAQKDIGLADAAKHSWFLPKAFSGTTEELANYKRWGQGANEFGAKWLDPLIKSVARIQAIPGKEEY